MSFYCLGIEIAYRVMQMNSIEFDILIDISTELLEQDIILLYTST